MSKMSMIRRAVAMILVPVLLLIALASCATEGDPLSEDTTASPQTMYETEVETELKDWLPADLNYSGEHIVIITPNPMSYDEMSGVALEDAVIERNQLVEDRLGVELEFILNDDATDKVITAITGGSDDYDILGGNCWRTALNFSGNFFWNLKSTKYLDFDKPWWNQSLNDSISYKNAQFGIGGDLSMTLYNRTVVTVFNKELFTDAHQTFPYEYVENGTWTLDKQMSLIPMFHKDNGNGVQDLNGDVYGFVTNDFICVDPYWASGEVDIISKTNDGEYEWVFDSGKLHDVADKVLALYYQTDGATYVEKDDYKSESTVISLFASGQAAMASLCLEKLEAGDVRGMSQEYGVVPIPKFSEAQTTYYSQMSDHVNLFCIPNTVDADRADMLSAVLEAMCSTSYHILRPVYYETVLRTQVVKDPQSSAMMEIIINNLRMDAGFVYSHSMGSFHQGFQHLVERGQNDAVSRYKRMTSVAQRNLEALAEQFERLVAEQE